MSQLDEVERHRLAEAVSQMEVFLHQNTAALDAAVLRMLNNFIENARHRLALLDEEITVENRHRKETEEQKLATLHRLAERELALTREERETYSRFLEKDSFTKSDFTALSGFYSSAWDRLSEGGKAEMSTRVWEGVRRQEYTFSELPEVVKQKEAERLHLLLLRDSGIATDLGKIPQADRDDFQSAWTTGKRKEACEILDRPSFAENVAVSSREIKSSTAVGKTADEKKLVIKNESGSTRKEPEPVTPGTMGTADFTGLDFKPDAEEQKGVSPTQIGSAASSGPKVEGR
jgi:hypothetical protein